MLTRILVAIVLITLICACTSTSTRSPFAPINGNTKSGTQQLQQARWERIRKCELMVLASNEPDKAHHIAPRCHRPW